MPDAPYPALSLTDRLLLLVLAVGVFFAFEGLPWSHSFQWDAGILWSYAVVPLLVLAALAIRRRLALLPWLLHSLEIAVGKFGITAGLLLLVLIVAPPRAPAPAPAPVAVPAAPRAPARPLPPPPVDRGRVAGRITLHGAPPPPGTVVFVSAGLPAYAWPPPGNPVALVNDGQGMEPRLAVVQLGQPVTAASTDRRLHTLILTQAGSTWRLNVPLLADGQPTPLALAGAMGVAEERCALHPSERAARLVVLPHPFHQTVGPDGSFLLDGIPTGEVTLEALLPDGTALEKQVTVQTRQVARVEW